MVVPVRNMTAIQIRIENLTQCCFLRTSNYFEEPRRWSTRFILQYSMDDDSFAKGYCSIIIKILFPNEFQTWSKKLKLLWKVRKWRICATNKQTSRMWFAAYWNTQFQYWFLSKLCYWDWQNVSLFWMISTRSVLHVNSSTRPIHKYQTIKVWTPRYKFLQGKYWVRDCTLLKPRIKFTKATRQ